MPKFGERSEANLVGVHPDLVALARAVVEHFDCTVIDGARTMEEQVKNVERRVSRTLESKHLPQSDGLSHAIDIVPFPIDWDAVTKGLNALRAADPKMKTAQFYAFIGFIKGMAVAKGIPIRQGSDWDGDEDFGDHSFIDLPHVERKTS